MRTPQGGVNCSERNASPVKPLKIHLPSLQSRWIGDGLRLLPQERIDCHCLHTLPVPWDKYGDSGQNDRSSRGDSTSNSPTLALLYNVFVVSIVLSPGQKTLKTNNLKLTKLPRVLGVPRLVLFCAERYIDALITLEQNMNEHACSPCLSRWIRTRWP